MAAEDPRFLLHFKTLAKFNEKLADGTVSADKHLVFIKDAKQVWFKGTYYADNVKMDGITDFYNGWSITQSSATTLTITLTGKRWNANTRVWEAISKPLSVNSVTQSVAGLMSAADKVKLDGLNINNVSNISFSSNAAKVTATISKDNGNAADTSTTVNLPVASSTSAGSMSATDKIELDRISTANFALGAVTPTTSTVGIAASKTTISSGASAANNITLPAATQSVAGVMTAADKVKLDGLDKNALTDISADSDASKVTVTVTKDNGLNADTTETFDLPQASDTKAGTMTAKDKVELDRITTVNFALGDVTPNETSIGIAATKTVIEDGTVEQNPITLPASTAEKAGVQTAADKKLFDSLPSNIIRGFSTRIQQSNMVDIYLALSTINPDTGVYEDSPIENTLRHLNIPPATNKVAGVQTAADKKLFDSLPESFVLASGGNLEISDSKVTITHVGAKLDSKSGVYVKGSRYVMGTIPAATKTTAGVMTAADKVKLDVTLPNLIDSNKTNIDNYTVNGFKISTNPVLDGADIKITGYTKPSTTGALAAADSVNGALGKLEKKLDDEVTSRTNAVSNLTNTVNSNKSTIDNYTINGAKISTNPKITVTVGGSGNVVTTASFSGTVLTLTKGATYNNYSHPTGSGASKSTGLYKFSTDSTSHISGVTAVTKSDITALGIPSSDTNTTYSFSSGNGGFTVISSGGYSQTISIGKPSTAGTADKVANTLTFTGYQSKSYNGSAAVSVAIPSKVSDLTNDSGYITSYTDTKNTTGSTNSSSKLYLVGATSQASSPVTYSNSGVYTQSGAVYASAGFYDTSDMRVKDNIESIDVSKADKIRLVEFDRTDREHHGYGVIAQELETVYPSMVNTDENGFKTVNYSEIYAVKIKYLEDKIAALEAVVDKLISK